MPSHKYIITVGVNWEGAPLSGPGYLRGEVWEHTAQYSCTVHYYRLGAAGWWPESQTDFPPATRIPMRPQHRVTRLFARPTYTAAEYRLSWLWCDCAVLTAVYPAGRSRNASVLITPACSLSTARCLLSCCCESGQYCCIGLRGSVCFATTALHSANSSAFLLVPGMIRYRWQYFWECST